MNDSQRTLRWAIAGSFGTLLIFLLSLRWGAAGTLQWDLVLELRLPRVILALAVGMGLTAAGIALQALYANPLCEPYTLGISSGSALGAVIGSALGLQSKSLGLFPWAFMGALVFTGILQLIASRVEGNPGKLLLAGVILGFFGSSLVALWMALTDPNGIQGILIWLLGDLSRAHLSGALSALSAVLTLSYLLWRSWRDMDALLLGEESARSLGVETARLRRRLTLWTALLVGWCISASGMIGFLGLIVPHWVRAGVGASHRLLIPIAMLWGGTLLMAADLLSRVAARPYELPVGVVTALLGSPLFLLIALKSRGRT